jgi:hypothetical protein
MYIYIYIFKKLFNLGSCVIPITTIHSYKFIEKDNIRKIVHFGTPPSLADYMMGIDKGGIDGLDTSCVLLHNEEQMLISSALISRDKDKAKQDQCNGSSFEIRPAVTGHRFRP